MSTLHTQTPHNAICNTDIPVSIAQLPDTVAQSLGSVAQLPGSILARLDAHAHNSHSHHIMDIMEPLPFSGDLSWDTVGNAAATRLHQEH